MDQANEVGGHAMGTAAAWTIGIVFLASGFAKVRSLPVFAEQIADYRILPYRLTRAAAVVITSLELGLAALLAFSATRRPAAAAASILLLIFVGALVSARVRGQRIDCACFGVLSRSELDVVGLPTILRTSTFTAIAVVATFSSGHASAPQSAMSTIMMLALTLLAAECARLFTDLRRATKQIIVDLRLDERTGT